MPLLIGIGLILKVALSCLVLGDIGNATKVVSGNGYLDETRYSCKPGYTIVSGDAVRTCTVNGTWSGTPVVCEPAGDFTTTVSCLGAGVNLTCDVGENITQTLIEIVHASFGVTVPGVCGATGNENCPSNGSAEVEVVRDLCQYNTFCNLTADKALFGDPCPYNTSGEPFLTVLYLCMEFSCTDPGNVTNGQRTYADFQAYSYVNYTCDPGYEITSGDSSRMCHPNGSWTGSLPTCSGHSCGDPGNVTQATRVGTMYYPGNFTFTCNDGWRKLSGNQVRMCGTDKQWTGRQPMCARKRCPGIDQVTNGIIVDNGHLFEDTLNYTCIPGYELTNNLSMYTRECTANKTWTGSKPSCRRVNCGPPPTFNHTHIEGSDYLFGDVVNYTCNYPFIMLGYDPWMIFNCSENATWTGDQPVCNLGGCGDPGSAAHSTRKVPNYNTLQNVTYKCRTGYEWNGVGNLARQCLKSGWTGRLPVCDRKCCSQPAPVSQSSRHGNSFCYQDAVIYSCDLGYEISSGDEKRICTENKTWTGTPPVCDLIYCGEPVNTEEGVTVTGNQYKVGDVVSYACKPGFYYLGGSYNRTCRTDKNWGGIPMRCRRKSCGDPPPITRTRRFGASFLYQDILLYNCFTGYNLTNGTLVKECLENGSWSGEDPFCDAIPGPPPNERKAAWKGVPKAEAAGSTYVGGIAVGLLAGTATMLVCLDLMTIKRDIEIMRRNLQAGKRRYSRWKDSRMHSKVAPQ